MRYQTIDSKRQLLGNSVYKWSLLVKLTAIPHRTHKLCAINTQKWHRIVTII